MQYLLKRLKLPKSTEISENSDHSKSNYCRGFNLCAVKGINVSIVAQTEPTLTNTYCHTMV